ncbi:MAG: hypothetical protein HY608_02705 [Planctomycetes bacterium]|nr:hypothetical protein [Planctomycetota bacterium]
MTKREIERYRATPPEERFHESIELMRWAWESLDEGGPERAARRWELIRRQHDLASERLEAAFRGMA